MGGGLLEWSAASEDLVGLQMAYDEGFVRDGLAVRIDAPGGDAPPASYGEADPFGYRWASSDAAGGPDFDWFDVARRGQALALGDDDAAEVALPFPFPFYGHGRSRVAIGSNGYLTFGGDDAALSNVPVPSSDAPTNAIFPFWDDLDPSAGGAVHYYHDAGADRFVVQYTAVPRFGEDGEATFQVHLYPSGDVLFQYRRMRGRKDEATVGFGNAPYGHLTASPIEGTLLPGASEKVDVRIDAAGLPPGPHRTRLVVNTNVPDAPTLAVPVEITVEGPITTGGEETLPIASVAASRSQEANVPANAADDDPATRWSAQGNGEWIAFGLGVTARHVRLVGRGNSARGAARRWTSIADVRLFASPSAGGGALARDVRLGEPA